MRVGDTFEQELVKDLKRTQIVQYAGASGDYNPIHTDEKFASEIAGYPTVFAHGMLTMGMSARILTDRFAPEKIKMYGARFTKQVFPGDDLSAKAEVVEVNEVDGKSVASLKIATTNQDGDVVLTASAEIYI